MRGALVAVALLVVGGVATASPAPDENTDIAASEANLESAAPRSGLVLSVALGAGVLAGGDIGTGTGGAVSLRIGHVATHRTVITFELAGSGALHKRGTDGATVTDSNTGLFAGALRYASRSTWVRVAGGPVVFNANVGGGDEQFARGGVGGLAGAGLDLVRWGYLVLGVEVFGMVSAVRTEGFKLNTGLCLGLSYY